ncbi:MAG: DNA translocase FtsK 4TM domain-containing protein, partial [Bdellovibrionales bacterium]|nr:DNA translocase FtsK 4TM domain-containing protein [Bdellovibrionales bacterium]
MANNTKHKSHTTASNVMRDFAGLLLLFLSLFTFLALLSHHSMDPSFFTSTTQPARNLAGKIGSHWSAFLLQSVGAAAFLVGALFLLAGVALFRRVSRTEWFLALLNYVFLLLSATALLGIAGSPLTLGGSRFAMGGLLGSFTGEALHSQLNTAGAVLLTLCLTVFAVSLSTRVSVRNL